MSSKQVISEIESRDAFFHLLRHNPGLIVLKLGAEWCGPCRMIAPALDEISREMGDKAKIVKLNVDENPAVAAQYGIRSIPTLLIFKNGQLASQKVGAASKTDLSKWISTNL